MGGQRARKKLMWVARCAGARDRAARDAALAAAQQHTAHANDSPRPPSILDAVLHKMAELGLQPDAAPEPAPPQRTVHLWPENARTWAHFLDLGTQWRVSDGGAPQGLDYAGCRAHLAAVRGAGGAATWDGIRACEAGYIAGWHHGAWHKD